MMTKQYRNKNNNEAFIDFREIFETLCDIGGLYGPCRKVMFFFPEIVSLLIISNKRLLNQLRAFTLQFQSIPCTDNILILN